jgi:hypothetical protein
MYYCPWNLAFEALLVIDFGNVPVPRWFLIPPGYVIPSSNISPGVVVLENTYY